MKYWLVISHIGKDYFIADDDDYALEHVEDVCLTCGDRDFIEGSFVNVKEAEELIKGLGYGTDYAEGLIQEAAELLSKPE